MRTVLAVYGAIDRMNYGDLLFPVILDAAFGQAHPNEIKVECFGLIASNLHEYGALPSRAIQDLFDTSIVPDDSRVVVAGGEVLSCNWVDAHFYLEGRFSVKERVIKKALGPAQLNRAIARSYGLNTKLPFLLSPRSFKARVEIGYNAVGGSNLELKPQLAAYAKSVLGEAQYVSVRDHPTYDLLKNVPAEKNGGVRLHPDSAVVMSELFPRERLAGLITRETQDVLSFFQPGQYLCLQIKKSMGSPHVELIVEQLKEVYRESGLPVVLLPIGRAFGHSDDIVLAEVQKRLTTPSVLLQRNTIYDTMALIANAAAYAGTSLHGAITAISYGVPHFALSRKDLKVPSFLDTWDLDAHRVIRRLDELAAGVRLVTGTSRRQLEDARHRVVARGIQGLCELAQQLKLPAPAFRPTPALSQVT